MRTSSPNSGNSMVSLTGSISSSNNHQGNSGSNNNIHSMKSIRSESMAYPTSKVDTIISKVQFHVRQHTKAVACTMAFVFVMIIITSDAIHDMGRRTASGLRGKHSYSSSSTELEHWGGAIHYGIFQPDDAIMDSNDIAATKDIITTGANTMGMIRFATVTDLDQLSAVKDSKKPEFYSLLVPGILQRTSANRYEIHFEQPRTLITKHNEAGRGAEFSELTIYNDRLLTFDDRTGDIFEIINHNDGLTSDVVPRFVITEGDGETDKGMKWEWATVKDNELYMGSMGKEFTKPDGSIANVNNLWIGILNAHGELRRENWNDRYTFVRKQLGAEAPGYIIMEAILWSQHMKKWIFLPRRISSTKYDEVEDERKGGNKLVLVDEHFKKAEVVVIDLYNDPLRGFSSFAFVPGTQDQHAIAIRSVEENCTGALDVCQQRSYFLVFDIKSGKVLSDEIKYPENLKFEGIEFVNIYTKPE